MDHHDHDHMAGAHDHHEMVQNNAVNMHRQHEHHGGGGSGEEGGMECSMQMIVSWIKEI